ncbi:MAG: DctP family TRAP transporter solute-binding subunit [Aminobacterium sp.]|jgi:C4-dicarboxylate-binding protein DctP|nr:DctP family TRAP transporter solute-binding subunit [Aminobacterium sp.]MDD3708520.1 DctP family TRAP transporter solute-binding subunit [Aminobacterium sp.]MDD4227916.1 DctP family TRAP transporter solute-binding subunit [Aminobacterium sp.]MDD4550644.1 DctP family TRAP transporter solute-binding subunit [Aminobacterium sp.]
MKKLHVLALVLAFVLAFSGIATAAEYNWRLAEEEIAGSVCDLYANEFARLLAEKSNGRIQLDVYPQGTLGTPTEMFELCLNGAIEFALVGPGQCGAIVPENQIFSLQFLFSDDDMLNEKVLATSKALNEDLAGVYETKGLKVLSYFSEGAMYWTGNKPLLKPEDFSGFKIRVMPSEMLVETYKAYGANPTPLSFTELYSALQLNMVEGQENAPYIIQEMKFMEVQKYLIASKHNIYVMHTLANADFYKSLPEDIKQIVEECIAELRPFVYKVQQDLNDKRLDMMVKAFKPDQKLLELEHDQRMSFREIAKKADEKYFELSGNPEFAKKLLEDFRAEMAAAEKELATK